MPAAIQTSVLDVLKSAQNSADGSLNVNATLSATNVTVTNGSGASAVNIQDGGNSITVDGSVSVGTALPAGTNAIGKLAANDGVDIGDVTINNSTLAVTQSGTWTIQPGNTANTTAWLVKESTSSTSTLSNVNASASTVSILSSNSSRLGAMFFNDSAAILYLKLGTTASTTSYTVQLPPNAYYELPGAHIYTGAIDGIWSSATGAVRVTELT